MGRYTSVAAYSDANPNMRKITLADATSTSVPPPSGTEPAAGAAGPPKGGVKTEKIHNPYGSVAGAGEVPFAKF